MKILALSDHVVEGIYSPAVREQHGDVDLVIGCGDLPYYYLEYIVSMLPVPLVYVFGNHDREQYTADGRRLTAPAGGQGIEGRVARIGDLLVAGLGGSIRYQPRGVHQYTQGQMRARILRLLPALLVNRVRFGRYLDMLVTHSPPYGIHDGQDPAHVGFKSFLTFMRWLKPAYLLHGHKHVYGHGQVRETQVGETTVLNVYPSRVIYWDDANREG